MSVELLSTALTRWIDDHGWQDVEIQQNFEPRIDPDASYRVIYEASIDPMSINASRVEIWLTSENEIAVGIDSCDRVARRLGVKTQRSGFAAGHEPLDVSNDALLSFLEMIAAGEVLVHVTSVPVFGVLAAKAAVSNKNFLLLRAMKYPVEHWLVCIDATERSMGRNLVKFAPWH